MLAKFSVKKPFTVLVAVILVVILGVVAFTRMTPDLLPNIDLPYVIVVTSYVGATPEEVESLITKPIEQSVATLDHIKHITSTSRENASIVMLEFADEADMDATTMNIREKLELIGNNWNDYVGTPTILKLNPDMLPLAVSAVSYEGMDAVALSKFYEETLRARLEGIEGVASISASGLIYETVRVTLREEKLDAANARIRAAVDDGFVEGEEKISDAQEELSDGLVQLLDGQEEIDDGRKKLSSAKRKLSSELGKATDQLNTGLTQLEAARAGTEQQLAQVEAGLAAYESRRAALVSGEGRATQLTADIANLTGRIARLRAALGDPDALSALGYGSDADAQAAIAAAESDKTQKEGQLSALIAALGMEVNHIPAAIAAIDADPARLRLVQTRTALQAALTQIASNEADAQAALTTLADKSRSARSQLSAAGKKLDEAEEQLADTKTQLDDAKKELDDAAEELIDAKEEAYKSTDLYNLLTLNTIGAILGAENFAMPAGYADGGGRSWLVSVGDKFADETELPDLILFDLGLDGLDPIRLLDVADVTVTDNAAETYAKIDGNEGVLLSLSKQSGYATANVSDNVKEKYRALEQEFPGLKFTSLMDQGDYIYLVISEVLKNLALGAVLAVVILFLFLRDVRPTFIVACSIPISVTFAIVLMYFSGVTLNIISMSGLAVGVGMLVDNSIVVIENIYRLRKEGVPVYRAAISGATQVAGAVTASTLTTVCVFVPIVFIEGITRQLFQDMALTIAYSLLASLVVALTLVPAVSAGLLKKTAKHGAKEHGAFMRAYEASLRFALNHKLLCLLLVLVLLAGSLSAALSRGFIYMPSMDSEQMNVTITLDEDATLDETRAVGDEVARRVMALPEVETAGVMTATGLGSVVGLSTGSDAVNAATLYVVLGSERERSSLELTPVIEALCADLPATVTVAGSGGMDSMSALSGSGIAIDLYCDDLETLRQAAKDVSARLMEVDGVESVSDGLDKSTPALRITVDKQAAMLEGLTVAEVYQQIAALLRQEASITTLEASGRDIVVSLREDEAQLSDVREGSLTFQGRDGTYRTVKIADIATFAEGETLSSIGRSEQRRTLSVTGTLRDGENITLVTERAKAALAAYTPPAGLTLEFSGENQTIMDAMNDLMLMLLLGVVIVYLIMVAQFQSLLSPFIVMMTIPLAFTGGLIALLIAGFEISIVAMIGFVMLVGIIVNNGIVLIDAMNQLRAEGMERRAAVYAASKMRLRPVLMTALTTVLGLVPLGFGFGTGASLVQPVAVVAIGGLTYATFMTLYIVPIFYELLAKRPPRVVTNEDLTPAE